MGVLICLISEGFCESLGHGTLEGLMSELGTGDSGLHAQPCLSLAMWFNLSLPQYPSVSNKDSGE